VRLAKRVVGFWLCGFCFPRIKCHDICPQ
jgi:hypothetical protein